MQYMVHYKVICMMFITSYSIFAIEGIILTTKPEPINPKTKKRLMNVIINRPEELAVDERIFIKVPESFKDENESSGILHYSYDDHIMAMVIMDFINTVLHDAKKNSSQFDKLITKIASKKKHIALESFAQGLFNIATNNL